MSSKTGDAVAAVQNRAGAPQGGLKVLLLLDNKTPPTNLRAYRDSVMVMLWACGYSHLVRFEYNIVDSSSAAAAPSVTKQAFMDRHHVPAAPAHDAADVGDIYFLDPDSDSAVGDADVRESASARKARFDIWYHVRGSLHPSQHWMMDSITKGDLHAFSSALLKLVLSLPNNEVVEAMVDLFALVANPEKTVDVGAMCSRLQQIQHVLQQSRGDGLEIGSKFISLLIPRIFGRDRRFDLALESVRMEREPRALEALLPFINKTAVDAAPPSSRQNVMAFAATSAPVEEVRHQSRPAAAPSSAEARAIADKKKPCFTLQRGRMCAHGDSCRFSHDPVVLASSPAPPEVGQRPVSSSSRGGGNTICPGCTQSGHGLQSCPNGKFVPHTSSSVPVARLASASAPVEIGRDDEMQAMLANFEVQPENF
jgi:hypothetical protein